MAIKDLIEKINQDKLGELTDDEKELIFHFIKEETEFFMDMMNKFWEQRKKSDLLGNNQRMVTAFVQCAEYRKKIFMELFNYNEA